jgi:DNA-binding XRE family transcriptional regulator
VVVTRATDYDALLARHGTREAARLGGADVLEVTSEMNEGGTVFGDGIEGDRMIAKRWMKEPGFKKGYEALEEEFSLASQLIEARARAGLTQAEVAERMGTSQSTVARLESGGATPSLSTLRRFAQATGAQVRITLEAKPVSKKDRRKRAA